MQAVVHSASVSPIFMWEWSPLAQSSSVTTPRNVRCRRRGRADAPRRRDTAADTSQSHEDVSLNSDVGLFARDHQMRGRRARVHDPHAAAAAVVGQAERRRGGHRDGDRHVRPGVLLVGTRQVIPHRSEFRLHAGAVFFRRVESGLRLRLVAERLELDVLSRAVKVAEARALN